jgi:hypothetical protein
MTGLAVIVLGILVAAAAAVAGHFALIEIGREVVTLRTQQEDGSWLETRLWVVDYDGSPWLHSAGADWERRFQNDPEVELVRDGETRRYRAHPDRDAHAAIDAALRRKYGVADRWVRFLAPCDESVLPVRLVAVPEGVTD